MTEKTAIHLMTSERLMTPDEIKRRQRQFDESVTPFIKEKIRIINLLPRKIIMSASGELQSFEPVHTPDSKAYIDEIDRTIDSIRKRCFEDFHVNL